jgi:hypothetical protein
LTALYKNSKQSEVICRPISYLLHADRVGYGRRSV